MDQLPSYDDNEEDILLMDTDGINLQLDDPPAITEEKPVVVVVEKKRPTSSMFVREKLKVYIRDGPNAHHVESISSDEKYYDFPTVEQLASIDLTEEKMKEIWSSLNLTVEDFRSSSEPFGLSRPESLFVHGVTKMSTQEILNQFEEFQPIGIEWISDQTCNVFWHEALSPLRVLAEKSISKPDVPQSSKRKRSSQTGSELPPGPWRQANFEPPLVLHLRYTTLDDRKARGAENQSEYYRQYGNPNYNNMTGLISRSKKRALNAMKDNEFRDFTVVKSNDGTTKSSAVIVDESATSEEKPTDEEKVNFTVVLPPKKDASPVSEDEEDEQRSKRRRRARSSESEGERTHFTVTMDPPKSQKKKSEDRDKHSDGPEFHIRTDETPVLDAREILERKRRNRR